MTELTLKVNHEAKTVQTNGRVAVGEDVALNLVMDEEVADLAQLRVRLRFMGRDVAVFPFPGSGDEWTEGEVGEDEYTYTGIINLNTVQLNALFAELGDGAVLTCAVVVDQVSNDDGTDDYNVLYGKGAMRVWNWGGDLSVTPDVDEAPAPVSLRECLDGKVDKVVTATGGNIAVFTTNGGVADGGVSVSDGALSSSSSTVPTSRAVKTEIDAVYADMAQDVTDLEGMIAEKADSSDLADKADKADLNDKVDKVAGKGLSSNDFTDALKDKLDDMADYSEEDAEKLAGIANGATKVTVDTEITEDSGNAVSSGAVFDMKEHLHQKIDGKADLENGKVPVSQLPSFVSDVKEYPSAADFPEEGEAAKIYVAKDTNLTYRWSGTGYVEISQSLALGETSSTAYAGNKGKANADAIAAIKDGTNIDSFGDVETALEGKQDALFDLATIRAGAAAGATAYQKPSTGIPATDLAAAVQTSLGKADTALQTAPVQSVNGQTGAVVLGASDVGALTENDLGNLSANIVTGGYVSAAAMDVQGSPVAPAARLHYALGSALNASGQLADRTCNHVFPLAGNVADIVLTFPDVPSEGGVMLLAARDFLVLVTNTAGNTGSITFTPPTGATVYGDGFTNAPASGETWLYSVTEVADNTFWAKSVKMEVAQ